MSGRRVLVCGGRDFGEFPRGCPPASWPAYQRKAREEARLLVDMLSTFKVDHGIAAIIHGAARGADRAAGFWARRQMIPEYPFPADWRRDGKAAGPIRNQRMIDEGRPDVVIAFPGGRGTADMVRRARAAGIEVIEVPAPAETAP